MRGGPKAPFSLCKIGRSTTDRFGAALAASRRSHLQEAPLSKNWIVKHVAGLPGMFEMVTSDPDSPMPRPDAMIKLAAIEEKGWRGWAEHMATGKRAAETASEKAHQDALKRIRKARKITPGITSRVHKMYDD